MWNNFRVYSSIYPLSRAFVFVCASRHWTHSNSTQIISNFYHQLIDFWSFVAVTEGHAIEKRRRRWRRHQWLWFSDDVCVRLFVCNKSPNPLFSFLHRFMDGHLYTLHKNGSISFISIQIDPFSIRLRPFIIFVWLKQPAWKICYGL